MALMEWTNDFSVNVKEIDDQHKKLFGMVNNLHDTMLTWEKSKGNNVTCNVLSGLVQYVAYHFATEERLMNQHAYPDYEKHKAEHDALTKQVLDLQKQFEGGNKPMLPVDLSKFLKDWLTKHTLGTDKKYSPFLNSKGVV